MHPHIVYFCLISGLWVSVPICVRQRRDGRAHAHVNLCSRCCSPNPDAVFAWPKPRTSDIIRLKRKKKIARSCVSPLRTESARDWVTGGSLYIRNVHNHSLRRNSPISKQGGEPRTGHDANKGYGPQRSGRHEWPPSSSLTGLRTFR